MVVTKLLKRSCLMAAVTLASLLIYGCNETPLPFAPTPSDTIPVNTIPLDSTATVAFDMGYYTPSYFSLPGDTTKYENQSQHSVYVMIDSGNSGGYGRAFQTHTDTTITTTVGHKMRILWYGETNPYSPTPSNIDTLTVSNDTIFYYDVQVK